MWNFILIVIALAVCTETSKAQSWQAEGHTTYSRTTQSHTRAWGAGGQVAGTWGSKSAPVQLSMSLGGDWMSQENGGPNQWSLSWEPTLQPGGGHPLTPYVGGGVSANWYSGSNAPRGALLGLNWIAGVQYKPEQQGPLTLKLEYRPGYVRTQEHTNDFRFGISWSI
jgi:opacity protein-like surface antigen